jgi:hypothetical protein
MDLPGGPRRTHPHLLCETRCRCPFYSRSFSTTRTWAEACNARLFSASERRWNSDNVDRKTRYHIFSCCDIACALFESVGARRSFRFGELMAYLRRGGRSYAKEEQEAQPCADRPTPAGSRPFQDFRTQQPQLSEVTTKLSICDGPIHQLVLF